MNAAELKQALAVAEKMTLFLAEAMTILTCHYTTNYVA